MNTSSLIVLLVYVACVACANFNSLAFADDSNSGNRIVGGDDATLGQFPYQVSLRDVEVKDHICGGSILTSRFILTAEHCTRHQQPKDIVAVVGAVRLTEGGIVIRLNKITAHENYTDFGNYDVSLIRTQDEIIFTDTVQPIALPTHDTGDDVRAILCGWGMLGGISRDGLFPINLQFIETHTITNEECEERMSGYGKIYDEFVCTINPHGFGACYGDSGGPLVDISNPAKKTLVGITSFGRGCGEGYPDVFMRVFSIVDWIKKKIEEQTDSG